jgi:transposase
MLAWFPTEPSRAIAARIQALQPKDLGQIPVVLPILRTLGLCEAVDACCPSKRDRHLSHGQVLEALVLHVVTRFGRRRIPLYHLQEDMEKSGLAFACRLESQFLNESRFGRALDTLEPMAEQVVQQVVLNLLRHYRPVIRWVHHDLTEVLFSGVYEGSELLTYGYNHSDVRQKQINLELDVAGPEGWVLWGSVIPGKENGLNTFESSLEHVIDVLGADTREGGEGVTFITDRIFLNYPILATVLSHRCHIIGSVSEKLVPEGWIEEVAAEKFQPLEYQSQHDPHNRYSIAEKELILHRPKPQKKGTSGEVLPEEIALRGCVVYSEGKHRNDWQGREEALQKIEKRLLFIQEHLNQRQYAKRPFVLQQIQKALGGTAKGVFAEYLGYSLEGEDRQLRLQFWRNEEALREREKRDGKYVLATDRKDISAKEVLEAFKEQHQVEGRHRNYKTDLLIRPLWLQNEQRIEALSYIYLFALMVYTVIEVLYRRNAREPWRQGVGWTGRRVLEAFGSYYVHCVTLAGEEPVWVLGELEAQQEAILNRLQLPRPEETLAR